MDWSIKVGHDEWTFKVFMICDVIFFTSSLLLAKIKNKGWKIIVNMMKNNVLKYEEIYSMHSSCK